MLSRILAAGFMRKRSAIWVLFFLLWLALGVFSAGTIFVELPPIRRIGPPPPGTLSMGARTFWQQLAVWLGWVVASEHAVVPPACSEYL